MRPVFRLAGLALAAACLTPPPVLAAKPKGCLTSSEMQTEQLVRHGVFLREAANHCNDSKPGVGQMWKTFDTTYNTRLSGLTAKRASIFKREFPKNWRQMMIYFDGRMVTAYRNASFENLFCGDVQSLLTKIRRGGWPVFARQAKVIQDNVRLDFHECGK